MSSVNVRHTRPVVQADVTVDSTPDIDTTTTTTTTTNTTTTTTTTTPAPNADVEVKVSRKRRKKEKDTTNNKNKNNTATTTDFKKHISTTHSKIIDYVLELKTLETEQKQFIVNVLKDYYNKDVKEAMQTSGSIVIPFGQHKGKTIETLWNDDQGKGSGRSYLLWLSNQSWLFDDIRTAIFALKETL